MNLENYFSDNQAQLLEEFMSFLRFPSVSSEPKHHSDVTNCCEWLVSYLADTGLKVERWETPGHPTVFAESKTYDPSKPTVLIYNHYDVQPVDPLELWDSGPFAPVLRDGEIYARGAQDNKGQCFYVLTAIKALCKSGVSLPINLKLIIEGEEEIGSPNLPQLLKERADRLKADHLLVVDLGIHALSKPAVTLGVRGIVTMSITLTGSNRDLHSGSHGGVVYNPNHALVELLAKLRDSKGRIAVPGFYDQVAELSAAELARIGFDFDPETYYHLFAAQPTGGEQGFTPFQSAWVRPTLEINGVSGGYAGEGFKTVIPAKATAKLSCRLVPDQDPIKTASLITAFLEQHCPPGIAIQTEIHPGVGRALRSQVSGPAVQAVARAYTEVVKTPCSFILEGASIPIIPELSHISGAEVVLMGCGLPDDNIPAPNRHLGGARLEVGFKTIVKSLQLIGNTKGSDIKGSGVTLRN